MSRPTLSARPTGGVGLGPRAPAARPPGRAGAALSAATLALVLATATPALGGPQAGEPPAAPSPAEPPAALAAAGAPTLARVVALAREQAPHVVAARQDVAVGRAEQVGARLPPLTNPYLELTANRGTQGATRDVALSGTLFLPVEVSGQRGRRIAEADALVGLRESELSVVRAEAAAEAVRAFGAAAVAGARVRAWERMSTVARDEAEVYAARLAVRDATEQDAKIARVEHARQAVALAEARADVTRALSDLRRLTGARFADPPLSEEPPDLGRREAAAVTPRMRAYESEATYQARVRDRQVREAHAPLSILLNVGRGDAGEARFGGGLGVTFPIFRAGQGEAARADAARLRALALRDLVGRVTTAAVEGLAAEAAEVRKARLEVTRSAEPAALAAIEAAVAMTRAGKSDLLAVLTARRDYALLEARRLDLLQREWNIVSDVVALTGELP